MGIICDALQWSGCILYTMHLLSRPTIWSRNLYDWELTFHIRRLLTLFLDFAVAVKAFSIACFAGDKTGGSIDNRLGVWGLELTGEEVHDPWPPLAMWTGSMHIVPVVNLIKLQGNTFSYFAKINSSFHLAIKVYCLPTIHIFISKSTIRWSIQLYIW